MHFHHGDLGAARGYLDLVSPPKLRANFAWRATLLRRALDVASGAGDTLDEHVLEMAALGPMQEFIALLLVATGPQRGGHTHLFHSVMARATDLRRRVGDLPREDELNYERLRGSAIR